MPIPEFMTVVLPDRTVEIPADRASVLLKFGRFFSHDQNDIRIDLKFQGKRYNKTSRTLQGIGIRGLLNAELFKFQEILCNVFAKMVIFRPQEGWCTQCPAQKPTPEIRYVYQRRYYKNLSCTGETMHYPINNKEIQSPWRNRELFLTAVCHAHRN